MLDRNNECAAVAPADYREAMSHFAGAVHVVTTDGAAGRRGVTVSAAVSASDDAATVLVCLNRNRDENRWFEKNGCFAINTLCAEHLAVARAFAGEGGMAMAERFALAEWRQFETGAPVLKGARAALDCRVLDVQLVETHYVLFGRVVAHGEMRRAPALVYLDRQYQFV